MYQQEINEFVESTPVRDCNPAFTSQENYDLSTWNDVPQDTEKKEQIAERWVFGREGERR